MFDKTSRHALFPTLVFDFTVSGAAGINTALADAILAERDHDARGLERSNFAKLGGWHSRTDLHTDPEFMQIARIVRDAGATIAEDLGYDDDHALTINEMWAIVNAPGASNRAHVHPGSLWSGVYYVQAGPGAGQIEFTDPRTANVMKLVHHRQKPDSARTAMSYDPVPGRLLMFPGWLYHAVHPNLSDTERVILSFNLSQS